MYLLFSDCRVINGLLEDNLNLLILSKTSVTQANCSFLSFSYGRLVSGKPSPKNSSSINNANANNANAGANSSNAGAVFFSGHEVAVATPSSIGGGDSTSQQQQPHHLHLGEDMNVSADSGSGPVDHAATSSSSPVVQRLNVHAHSHSPHPAESAMLADMEMAQTMSGAGSIVVGSEDKSGNNVIMEQSNVCKVSRLHVPSLLSFIIAHCLHLSGFMCMHIPLAHG